jgi:hypothetical protein
VFASRERLAGPAGQQPVFKLLTYLDQGETK